MSEFERFRRSGVPMPQTAAEYAACYRVNLAEARGKLHAALEAVRRLRATGDISDDPEEFTVRCNGEVAAKAWGAFVRWNSDTEHWSMRLAEAEAEARRGIKVLPAMDPRLPPDGDAEEVPF